MAGAPVIDVWANWWPAALFEAHPPLAALYRRLGFDERMDLPVTRLVDGARAAGVSRVAVSATAFPGSPVDNDTVADVVAPHADILAACASVDPREGMAAVRALRRAITERGMVGLKLLPFLYDAPPDDAIYFPLYAACIELGVPVLVLTGHTAVALPNDTGRPGHLDRVALHFPELTIIAGHAGYPWTQELVALAWKHENLFIDTSGHMPRYLPGELVRFADGLGRGKVMFGTGYPFMEHKDPVEQFRALGLKEKSLAAFLGGAAAKAWPALVGGEVAR